MAKRTRKKQNQSVLEKWNSYSLFVKVSIFFNLSILLLIVAVWNEPTLEEEAYNKGYTAGYTAGYNEGASADYEDGYDDGYYDGSKSNTAQDTTQNTPKSTPSQDYYTAQNTPESTPSNEDSRSENNVYADELRCSGDYSEYSGYKAYYQGIVYNDGDSDITWVKVNMNFYNSDGNFIGNSFTYLQPMDIRAGGKATFDSVALDLSSEFDGQCELASIEFDY